MKNTQKGTWFISGFLLMAIFLIGINCEKTINPPDNNDDPIIVDETQVLEVGKSIESLFLSADIKDILDAFTPLSQNHYKDLIESSSEETLKAFGEAFKTRELNVQGENYAEFEFTADGRTFSIALSLDGEGNWKISRI